MISKEKIKKVMTEVARLEKHCAGMHKGIKEALTADDVQQKIMYISKETKASTFLDGLGMKTFYLKDNEWYCNIDGSHASCKDYESESADCLTEKFINDFGAESEADQIEYLRRNIRWAHDCFDDYKKFKAETLKDILARIDTVYNNIKAKREDEITQLLEEYKL